MGARRLCFICTFLFSGCLAAYDAVPRWGQATAVVNDALFIHGGKTDQFNTFSYSSAPNNNDLLYLSLASPFEGASPPWQLISNSSNSSTSQGPTISWHTLSAFNTSEILLFGGQPGPNSPTVLVGEADSAFLLNIYQRLLPEWIPEAASWAGQPTRRIYHSSATALSGHVFIIGGERADGSDSGFSDHYVFDPNGPSFTPLPSDDSPPDLSGHKSIILTDGRLLVFGGYSNSQKSLIPLTMIWTLNVTEPNPVWTLLNVSQSSLPSPRRAFAAVLLDHGKILIHGGSDAVLQNNFADGWILDTMQSPMVWSEVSALSQLGARRDHFAISSGNQVLFGFGYDNSGPAPAALQIFDVERGSFTPNFTPLPRTSTPTPTMPGPSQTSKSGMAGATGMGSVHPTSTLNPEGPNNGNGGGSPNDDSTGRGKTTAIAVGTVFGVLGLLIIGIVGVYYIRRQQGRRQFTALRTGDAGDDDESSLHERSEIPAAVYASGNREFGHGWNFGVFNSLGLAGILGATTGSRNVRLVQERRDMLADEDARDLGEWYNARRRDGTGGSSWSLRSILTTRMRSRDASTGTVAGTLWGEKKNPFSDDSAPTDDDDFGYMGAAPTGRPAGRRQMSYASTRSSRSYMDPFSDPIQEEKIPEPVTEPKLHPTQPLPTLRTMLPVSMGGHALSPLPERPSQNTLNMNDPATSSSSHSEYHNSPFDASSSHLTSHTSLDSPHSPKPLTSSIIGANLPPNQPMRRSDTWWSRFSRTSFLDRRPSSVSGHPMHIPDIRDPNPPPRLGPIQESIHSTPSRRNTVKSRPNSTGENNPVLQGPSNVYGVHNKSLTSVRTADTEAIERIAGTMDVVQRVRTGSHRTTGSISTDGMSIDTHPDLWGRSPDDTEDKDPGYELSVLPPPVKTPTHPRENTSSSQESSPLSSLPPQSFSTDSNQKRNADGAVAARVHAYERRMSHDHEAPSPTNTRKLEERTRKKNITVNYGLAQRPSLYVANPDHRTTSSGNS